MDFLPEEFEEILNIFREETEEIIQKLNNNLLQLENKPNDKDKLVYMFRDAHSLKGAARMIGFNNIQRLAHKIEDLLGLAKENKIIINREISDVLYKSTDLLSFLIENSVKIKKEYYTDDIQKYIENIDELINKEQQESASCETSEVVKEEFQREKILDQEDSQKNIKNINALFSEALFMLTQINSEESTKYLETIYDTTSELEKKLEGKDYSPVKEKIEAINIKISFVFHNSNLMTTQEIQDLINDLSSTGLLLNDIYKNLGIKTVDFDNIIEKKIRENSQEPNVEILPQMPPENEELLSKLLFIKANLGKLENDLSIIPEINNAINHIISRNINGGLNLIYKKLSEVLNTIKKANTLPEKEVVSILKQSIHSTEKSVLNPDKDEEEDLNLILQRLDIVRQMIDLNASQNPLSNLAASLGESGISVKKAQDFFNSFETSSIKTLRVDTKKLDQLVNQMGELIITRIKHQKNISELEEILEELNEWKNFNHKSQSFIKYYDKKLMASIIAGDYASLSVFSKQIYSIFQENAFKILKLNNKILSLQKSIDEDDTKFNVIVTQLETMVKNIRVLPLATIFHMFPRMIRDISKDTGKKIELLISGSETSADKKIIEEIKTPLMHIIRNSIDHGIETPQERAMAGKHPTGQIHLHAKSLENKIVIEVNDDGRGIDLDEIKKRALEKKLVTEKEMEYLSNEQIMNIIFWSGFSTGDVVTEISGRGLGLDIVQTKISQLNGHVKVFSVAGHGTKISIELPISMSTMKAFIVKSANQLFALPMTSVKTVMWVNNEDIYCRNENKTILIDGKSTSVYELSELMGLPADETHRENTRQTLVIVEIENSMMGIIVDKILGDQEILQKKLCAPIVKLKNILGITTLVNGEVCLILNLIELYKNTYMGQEKGLSDNKHRLLPKSNRDYTILIVDDSLTTRALLKNILFHCGYNFHLVKNPKEAFEQLGKSKFDLILTDLEMPEMDGLMFVEQLKSNSLYKKIPIIIISSANQQEMRVKKCEADEFINKSDFNQEYLLEKIKKLLRNEN